MRLDAVVLSVHPLVARMHWVMRGSTGYLLVPSACHPVAGTPTPARRRRPLGRRRQGAGGPNLIRTNPTP